MSVSEIVSHKKHIIRMHTPRIPNSGIIKNNKFNLTLAMCCRMCFSRSLLLHVGVVRNRIECIWISYFLLSIRVVVHIMWKIGLLQLQLCLTFSTATSNRSGFRYPQLPHRIFDSRFLRKIQIMSNSVQNNIVIQTHFNSWFTCTSELYKSK